MLFAVMLMAADAASLPIERIDLAAHRHVPVVVAAAPRSETAAKRGTAAPDERSFPATLRMSPGGAGMPLTRAADVIDIARWPARAVAKLFRLDPGGTRTGTACTAEFVGPRHLVTAAHCIVDRTTGQPYPGFEIAAGFDGGKAALGTANAVAAWVRQDVMSPAAPADMIVTATNCSDYAVVEIDRPLGDVTGWLGLRDRPPSSTSDHRMLYRFSYPNQSATVPLMTVRDRPGTPAAVIAALDAEIAKARAHEPAFSPDNLYVDIGEPGRAEGLFIADPTGYALPGQSGSALLDDQGAIVGLLSRSYAGSTYSCRLDAPTIGVIAAITNGAGR